MNPLATPWPPTWAYALAHRCSRCKARPGMSCDVPRKRAIAAKQDREFARLGLPPVHRDPCEFMHTTRIDAGLNHYRRDQRNAPWPEDRAPGQRHDTLGGAWTPDTENGTTP